MRYNPFYSASSFLNIFVLSGNNGHSLSINNFLSVETSAAFKGKILKGVKYYISELAVK